MIAAQKLIMENMPWIPLVFIPPTAFVKNGICGVTLDFSQMYGPGQPQWVAARDSRLNRRRKMLS